jgi:hypothetical protein
LISAADEGVEGRVGEGRGRGSSSLAGASTETGSVKAVDVEKVSAADILGERFFCSI